MRITARCFAGSATGENQRSDGNMKGKNSKSFENGISEEIQLGAANFARAFMKLSPMTQKELKEKRAREEKELPFQIFLEGWFV